MLTGGPINSPSRVSVTPFHSSRATVGHARTPYYSLHTIPNILLLFLHLFPFYLFLMFSLCCLCESFSVVDLFTPETSTLMEFNILYIKP